MPRVIDADAFFNDFPEMRDYEYASQEYEVDAVKVVRCRNCKYYKAVTDSIGTCIMVNMNSTPEGYCAWAEREINEI